MAKLAEAIGVRKAKLPFWPMFSLAVLAGAFIALGANFSTIAITGAKDLLPWGLTRLLAGSTFSLGLILVITGGAELFTGNNLIIMAFASRRISWQELLRNWIIVYCGNFCGAIGIALLVVATRQHTMASGAVGNTMLALAEQKCQLDFLQAVASGIVCNLLVCLAVWICLSARSTADKIIAIIFPISAFVAGGFEHCVANMYFLPLGMMLKTSPNTAVNLTWQNVMLGNLLPVTIGNIIGGAILVGLVYWTIFLRHSSDEVARD